MTDPETSVPKEYCKFCKNSVLTRGQLEQIKKNYNANFRKLRENFEKKFQDMFEELKVFLMQTFKREYAVLSDNHRNNKDVTKKLKEMQQSTLKMLI